MLATSLPGARRAQLAANRRLERILRNARLAQASNPRTAGLAAGVTISDSGSAIPAAVSATNGAVLSGNPFSSAGAWAVRGGRPIYAVSNMYRVYSAVQWTSGGNIGSAGQEASVWRASIMHTGRYFAAKLLPTTVPYRFLVDGRFVSTGGTVLGTTSGNTPQYLLLDFGSRATRRVTVEGIQNGGFAGAFTEATGSLFAPANADEVNAVFLGDSYVYGSGATLNGDGLAMQLADWLGASMLASGAGGTGWATSGSVYRFDQRIASGDLALGQASPDVLFFMASVNDRALATGTITANALAGLKAARAQFPGVPMVVFGCAPASYGSGVAACETAVQAAVTALADPACVFVPVYGDANGGWIGGTGYQGALSGSGNSDWATFTDGKHPSDEGHAYLGQRYARSALKALQAMHAALVG